MKRSQNLAGHTGLSIRAAGRSNYLLEATAEILDKKNDNNQDDREEDRMVNQPPIPSLA
jgi:hypothetical protein